MTVVATTASTETMQANGIKIIRSESLALLWLVVLDIVFSRYVFLYLMLTIPVGNEFETYYIS